jgi:hypothetical protein
LELVVVFDEEEEDIELTEGALVEFKSEQEDTR